MSIVLVENLETTVWRESAGGLKMARIACVDDNPEELKKAQKVIQDAGHFFWDIDAREERSVMSRLARPYVYVGSIDGIITDLMFDPRSGEFAKPESGTSTPPGGLLVVIHALALGIPVVVCTNATEVGGHHGKTIGWIYDAYDSGVVINNAGPFGWIEKKNWAAALAELERRMKK